MQFLSGYKTYIVAIVAAIYAWVGYIWGGPPPSPIPPETLGDAIKLTLGAAALFGLRSGLATEMQALLAGFGIDLPPSPTKLAVQNAVRAAQVAAKRNAPAIIAVIMTGLVLSTLVACASMPNQDPATILKETEAGFAVAEATYDTICSINSPPSFCTDPSAVRAYSDAKLALEAAFKTADDAITASGGVSTDSIEKLLSDVANDWATYNRIVETTKAKATARGIRF